MKTTLQRIGTLVDSLSGMITICQNSRNKRELTTALSNSLSELDSTVGYMKENERHHYIPVRKALTSVRNVVSSLNDGLTEGMPPSEFRTSVQTLKTKFFPMVRAGLEVELEAISRAETEEQLRSNPIPEGVRTKIKIVLSKSNEIREAVKIVAQSNTVGNEVAGNRKLSELESAAQQARRALPVKIQGAFQIVRVPIVPLFPNPALNKSETLRKLGMKFSAVEGFVILQDQILLLVSKQRAATYKVAELDTATPKPNTKIPPKKEREANRAGALNVAPLALAHSVVEMLNERGATKYDIASDTPVANPRNTDLLMFWVLPRQRMNGMMKILGSSNTTAIVKWGLPLPSEKADVEHSRIARQEHEWEETEQKRQAEIERLALKREAAEKAKQEAKERAKVQRSEAQRKAIEDKKKRIQARLQQNDQRMQKKLQELARKVNVGKPAATKGKKPY